MNQKLSDWASIAEIISGVAVVITLVFLVVGIRENTEVSRASAYERSMAGMTEARKQLINDSELASLWEAFRQERTAEIEEPDLTRLSQFVYLLFGVYENAFYAEQYGILGPSEWGRFERQICIQYARVQESSFADQLTLVLTEDFLGYIDSSCASSGE